MHKTLLQFRFLTSASLIIALIFTLVGIVPNYAYAASLLNKSDVLSSQKVSTASNHTIVFRTPTGANQSSDTIVVTLPSGFTTNSFDFADVDLAHSAGSQSNCTAPTYSNEETLAASASATAWGAALSGQALTLTAPTDGVGAAAIATDACVQIQIGTHATAGSTGDTQITNHSTAASYTIAITGAFGDSGDIVINILNDDQVSVSATVDESLTFTISDNSIGFGTLSASDDFFASGDTNGSATEAEAHTLVVGTNAANGYTMTINGTTLTSGSNTITAIGSSNTASSTGTEQFGLRMTASGGSGSVTAPYAASGFAFDTTAFPDQIASTSGASANTTYSARYLANIGSQTEAGAYTATLTYVSAANF
jgi:trimeric autotransporter adhesin